MATDRVALTTALDLQERLLDQAGATADGLLLRKARASVQSGLDDFWARRPWVYLQKFGLFQTSGYYSTGTIAYDHTGGANERMVTLTSGTWPTWSAKAYLRISNVLYRVDSRVSASVITLSSELNPGADVASGTSYSIFQDTYQLPFDFGRIVGQTVYDQTTRWPIRLLTPEEWAIARDRNTMNSGTPTICTVAGDPDVYGAMAMTLYPIPSDGRSISYFYSRSQPTIRVWDYTTGTVSCAASTSATGSIAWSANHVGCVLRFGTATTAPTSLLGSAPYQEERVIIAVSGTTATLDQATDGIYSSVKFAVSQLADLEPGAMRKAAIECCQYHFAEARNADTSEMSRRANTRMAALRLAMEADRRFEITDSGVPGMLMGSRVAITPTNPGYYTQS